MKYILKTNNIAQFLFIVAILFVCLIAISGPLTTKAQTPIAQNEIEILWQTDGYVPPFYKGKPLYTSQSRMTFVAIPSFVGGNRNLNPKNFTYEWRSGTSVLEPNSGYGKNKLSLTGSIIARPMDVQATASTNNGLSSASKRIKISAYRPTVLIYENNPLYGIFFNNAITSEIKLSSDEIILSAFPYFMSNTKSALDYSWAMNANNVPANEGKSDITLRNTGGEGKAVVGVTVKNPSALLQSTDAKAVIDFATTRDSRF